MRDDDSYCDFVAARWSSLYRLAYLLAGGASDAEDLLQSSLLKTYVHWAKVEAVDSPDAYVRKTMVNTLLSNRRRSWWRREYSQDRVPETAIGSTVDDIVNHEAMWPVICALPERQRAVIVLRYYEDLSEEDIASVLGCSRGTVKSNASDAIAGLRRALMAITTETVPGSHV